MSNDRVRQFWDDFAAATGVEAGYRVEAFGGPDRPDLADSLALLVRDGPKRATAGLPAEYADDGETIPAVGDFTVIIDSQENPVCIIRTTEVNLAPFGSVDEQFAFDEGEGDRTLAWWRKAHIAFFVEAGYEIDDDTLVLLERFELLWPRRA